MNLKEIVIDWLKLNNYDGLYDPYECACEISDLMPYDEPHTDCCPGYKVICRKEHEFDFMITADKKQKDYDDPGEG